MAIEAVHDAVVRIEPGGLPKTTKGTLTANARAAPMRLRAPIARRRAARRNGSIEIAKPNQSSSQPDEPSHTSGYQIAGAAETIIPTPTMTPHSQNLMRLAVAGPEGVIVQRSQIPRGAGRRSRDQEYRADGQERERPRDRAQEREVVEEELREREPEEAEADDAKPVEAALEADVEDREAEQAPEGADRRVAALEVGR